ncbi:hypothetical protein DFH06DRAFT_1126274 [Mycena polygramma]|nr:hypothetical protein DFH06DRAFT_1126274 [Mycena polygramma]
MASSEGRTARTATVERGGRMSEERDKTLKSSDDEGGKEDVGEDGGGEGGGEDGGDDGEERGGGFVDGAQRRRRDRGWRRGRRRWRGGGGEEDGSGEEEVEGERMEEWMERSEGGMGWLTGWERGMMSRSHDFVHGELEKQCRGESRREFRTRRVTEEAIMSVSARGKHAGGPTMMELEWRKGMMGVEEQEANEAAYLLGGLLNALAALAVFASIKRVALAHVTALSLWTRLLGMAVLRVGRSRKLELVDGVCDAILG